MFKFEEGAINKLNILEHYRWVREYKYSKLKIQINTESKSQSMLQIQKQSPHSLEH